jgi:hypothetical protein
VSPPAVNPSTQAPPTQATQIRNQDASAPSPGKASPALGPPKPKERISYLRVDEEAQELARENAERGWKGVPNIAIGSEPVTVKVPERMPRQTLFLKEVKGPLFTNKERDSLWTAAEILGWHLNEYLRYPRDTKHDVERLKADATLEVLLKRAGKSRSSNMLTVSIFADKLSQPSRRHGGRTLSPAKRRSASWPIGCRAQRLWYVPLLTSITPFPCTSKAPQHNRQPQVDAPLYRNTLLRSMHHYIS